MATIFLVELFMGIRIRDWVATVTTGVYTRTLDAEISVVTTIKENGTTLTEKTSAAGVDAATGSWFYDSSTRVLRLHTADDGNANSKTELVEVLEPLMKGGQGGGLVKDRVGSVNTTTLFWDNRVIALPLVELELTPDDIGGGSVASLGELVLNNADGRYDRLIGERIFQGFSVAVGKGDEDDPWSTFSTGLWAAGLMEEPRAETDRLVIPLVSLGRRLDNALLTTQFDVADYANMDANIAGLTIPKIWGTVISAEAFRIASGRWKVAGHAMASIDAARKSTGITVTITGTDLPLGEFTVSTTHNDEDRLFVDCRGKDFDTPGEMIRDVAENWGIATASIDTAGLATLDTDRAVNLGIQILGGSAREALDRIAQSAFVDWFFTRTNKLTARARKRDMGNLVANPGFETDTTGWSGQNNATIARITSVKFRGSASLEITKQAVDALAYAAVASIPLTTGKRYTISLMAALTSGSTTAFRVALSDGVDEYLSDPVTLSSTQWTRVTASVGASLRATVYCDSTSVFCDSLTVFCDAGGGSELRIYPQHNGAGLVKVAIDEVELALVVLLDDTNTRYNRAEIRGPLLWRARAGYKFDGRTKESRFITTEDTTVQRLFETAESRETVGHLGSTGDASTVAQAILDYFGVGRLRTSLTLFSPERESAIDIGTVVDLETSRVPTLPGAGRLFRVIGFSEEHSERGVPQTALEAEAQYDAIYKQETITAT